MCLIKNNLKWKYNGVLHEYLSCETSISEGKILGDYYIISGRTSSRNNDPKKYIKDAEILEKGYHESLKNGDKLYNRYVYYCANSYNDAGMKEKAIEWYKKTLISEGWFDERYNSCLKLYELTGNKDYLVESYHHNPRRIEAICSLVRHYTCESKYSIAMCYYNFIKKYFENEWDNLSTKLFSNVLDYTFYLPYYMIIVCEKMKDYSTGVKMYSIIFDKKAIVTQWWYNNLFFNLQFFEGEESYKLLKIEEYISFVEKHGIEVDSEILAKCANQSYYPYKFDIKPTTDILIKECSKYDNLNTIKKLKEFGGVYSTECLEEACSVPKNGRVIKYLINECNVNVSEKCLEKFQEAYKMEALDAVMKKYKKQNPESHKINSNEQKVIELDKNSIMSIIPKNIKIDKNDVNCEFAVKGKIQKFFELKSKNIKYFELYEATLKYLISNKLIIGNYFIINDKLSKLLKINQCTIASIDDIHNILTYFIDISN
jgi:hypothetical protein